MEDKYFMNLAYQQALNAFEEGEVPIGAVIVKNNKIIGRGYNKMEKLNDATAHAEIIAITAASAYMETWRLSGCRIFVTVEPCMMCFGAIMNSRIDEIIFGTIDMEAGAINNISVPEDIKNAYGKYPAVKSGVMKTECINLLQEFFKKIRKNN